MTAETPNNPTTDETGGFSVELKRGVMPVNRYVLDLSRCRNLPAVFDGVRKLPLVDGEHESEYDLDEAAMEPAVVKRLRDYSQALYPDRQGDMPIGFNEDNKPVGAKVRKA